MSERLLVTGTTGYIGGRLVPRLLEQGYAVRCLVRDRSRMQGRPWLDQVEVSEGDLLRPETLPPALKDVNTAYYLVHSMGGGQDFHERDRLAARNFALAASQAGVQRIIYLGGLGDPQSDLSQHLRSRQETGDALREAGVPVTEFRAGVVVGSGSLSFELIRYLTERLPMMICPRWVFTRTQPIAIQNVLDYLVQALRTSESAGKIIEIGGEDRLTYAEMIYGYARARGLKRYLIPVPVLTPRLSSYWLYLVTPLPVRIARPLIEGLRNEVVVRDDLARRLFPDIHLIDYDQAVRDALSQLEAGQVETAWTDALVSSQGYIPPVILTTQEGMIIEKRQLSLETTAEAVYQAFSSLGGKTGWLTMNWAWQLRGLADRLVGGVGMRRSRRHPQDVRVGDAIDFWRVEAVEPGRLLRLRAEMKVPGRAWLQFQAQPQQDGKTLLVQTAFFAPKGLSGFLYWYLLYPIHGLIFGKMIHRIAARARSFARSEAWLNSPAGHPE